MARYSHGESCSRYLDTPFRLFSQSLSKSQCLAIYLVMNQKKPSIQSYETVYTVLEIASMFCA